MPLWRSDDPPGNALPSALTRELLAELTDHRETALLATPYLSFQGRISGPTPGELRLTTTLSKEAAERTLAKQSLRLRLPWGLSMVGGPVELKGHLQAERRRELVLSRPPWLVLDELRKHPRCELAGKSTFTLTREDLQQVRGILENLSMGGAGIFVPDTEGAPLLVQGALFEMGLRLEQGPEVRLQAKVVQGDFPRLGLAFQEPLAPAEAAKLRAWLQPRLDEALRRWENRKALRAEAEAAVRAQAAEAQAEGVLILGSQLFAEEVGEALEGLGPLKAARPVLASIRPLLNRPPQACVLQVSTGDLEERYRLRSLWQALDLTCPLVLLGTGRPGCAQELSQELRSAGTLQWAPGRGRFFQRMLQGLIRKA